MLFPSRANHFRVWLTLASFALLTHLAALSTLVYTGHGDAEAHSDQTTAMMDQAENDSSQSSRVPAHTEMSACGLGASLPVGTSVIAPLAAIASVDEQVGTLGNSSCGLFVRDHDPPRTAPSLPLLQAFRL
jgi:hypothetical protein